MAMKNKPKSVAHRLKMSELRKGRPSNRKGTILSEKTKELIRQKRVNQIITVESNLKRAASLRGAKSIHWRGGKTMEARRIKTSIEYRLWRKAVFERDDYTCQMCGERGGNLNADHIKPFALYPDLRLQVSNGRTLCIPCHKKTPTYLRNLSKDQFEALASVSGDNVLDVLSKGQIISDEGVILRFGDGSIF